MRPEMPPARMLSRKAVILLGCPAGLRLRGFRKGELHKIASRHHVMVLFLPLYSPELNPIEKLWTNMKRWLKNNIRYYSSFEDALETATDNYS